MAPRAISPSLGEVGREPAEIQKLLSDDVEAGRCSQAVGLVTFFSPTRPVPFIVVVTGVPDVRVRIMMSPSAESKELSR